jgi:hypothetical protein
MYDELPPDEFVVAIDMPQAHWAGDLVHLALGALPPPGV